MFFALRCVSAPDSGKWFSPKCKGNKLTDAPPNRLGQGLYPKRHIATGTAHKLHRLSQYTNIVWQIVPVEVSQDGTGTVRILREEEVANEST